MSAHQHRPRLRTDWFLVLRDLQYAGQSNAQVARILGVSFSTLQCWKQGSEPAHNLGHSLLEVWSEIVGKPIGERPMVFD